MNVTKLPNLFLDEESSDVQLCLETSDGDERAVFPGHTSVLRCASKVFRTMLDTANFKEGQTRTVELNVKGNKLDAIVFHRYLYTRQLEPLDMNVYISVLQTAHLYEVNDLVRLCNERIAKDITPLTVCQAYMQLKKVASKELITRCEDLMLEFAFLIFRRNLHLILDEKTMSFLLASDKLNVLDEEQALDALWQWGFTRRASNSKLGISIEKYIEALFCLIRKSLVEEVHENSPWFCLWQSGKSSTETDPSDSSTENSFEKRQPDKSNNLNRFSEVVKISEFSNQVMNTTVQYETDCISFSVDRGNILLSGLTMQLTVGANLKSPSIFHFLLNDDEITDLISLEMKQICEYTTQKMGNRFFDSLSKSYIYERTSEVFYVYDLTVSFRAPVALKKTQPYFLKMRNKGMANSGMSLKAYTFPKRNLLLLNQNLKIYVLNTPIAVTQMNYFI